MQDTELIFSADQALTTTAVGTNVIDTGVADRSSGAGTPVYLMCRVGSTALASGTSVTLSLQHSDAAGSGYTDAIVTPAIVTASLTAGAWLLQCPLPTIVAGERLKRYLGVNYTISGTYDAGTVDCWLDLEGVTTVDFLG